ncbi:murein transglycosylase A [Allosphingosinicella sp.]|jgi:membrane-bound lytic murein transglycosylase A|uniref:murein transglycosylase A n=1 Tax=Allosphingosinicella sp. TaxID=2823234 RepID=UPI002F0840C4
MVMPTLRSPLPLLAALALLASCVRGDRPREPALPPPEEQPAQPEPPQPPPPATAVEAGVRLAPALVAVDPAQADRALRAFRISCPSVTSRQDPSGLTRPEDWRLPCAQAAQIATPAAAAAFFRESFELVEVGDGAAFATGYYEPEIRGSRERRPGYDVPVYGVPPDLLDTNPLTGERGRGRLDETGAFVLYHDRTAIEEGALAGRGLEIAWAADPVDLFFLQIQGSGRLRLPDGSVMRIGYASQNGREYVAIGRLMRERGLIEPPVTMQRITHWLRSNPDQGRTLMRENKSYVFFRELTGPGPLGALGRPVTPRASVAADPRFVPLGAPVILSAMSDPRADGLWVAQDTGGAIRGANRFDTFWGAGEEAAAIAGGMQARGRALVLLPRGTMARIAAGVGTTPRP